MPYVIRTTRSGKKIEEDKYYTSRMGKKKDSKEAGTWNNPGKKKIQQQIDSRERKGRANA